MAILGIGTDIVRIQRMEIIEQRLGDRFFKRILTLDERMEAERLPQHKRAAFYAKRYAVKEAVSKALGTGIGQQVSWQDIEVQHTATGKPQILLRGKAEQTVKQLAAGASWNIHVSISDDDFAIAFVVLEAVS